MEKQIRFGLAAKFQLVLLLDLGYGVCKTTFPGVSSGGICWNLRLVLLFLLLLLVTTATFSSFTCYHSHLHMDRRYSISTLVKEDTFMKTWSKFKRSLVQNRGNNAVNFWIIHFMAKRYPCHWMSFSFHYVILAGILCYCCNSSSPISLHCNDEGWTQPG